MEEHRAKTLTEKNLQPVKGDLPQAVVSPDWLESQQPDVCSPQYMSP